jgi:hypothetical protein
LSLFSFHEISTLVHGIVFGGGFLLCFTGGLVLLLLIRAASLTESGIRRFLRYLRGVTLVMALFVWVAVLSGTYVSYPWYRAKPPEGVTDLSRYPRSYLKADPDLAFWHTFGMEWKEHIAWLVPLLMTAVAFIVFRYGEQLATDDQLRRVLILLLILAFAAAGIAGTLGALVTKAAPII